MSSHCDTNSAHYVRGKYRWIPLSQKLGAYMSILRDFIYQVALIIYLWIALQWWSDFSHAKYQIVFAMYYITLFRGGGILRGTVICAISENILLMQVLKIPQCYLRSLNTKTFPLSSSRGVNWNISNFPLWFSKILFVIGK